MMLIKKFFLLWYGPAPGLAVAPSTNYQLPSSFRREAGNLASVRLSIYFIRWTSIRNLVENGLKKISSNFKLYWRGKKRLKEMNSLNEFIICFGFIGY